MSVKKRAPVRTRPAASSPPSLVFPARDVAIANRHSGLQLSRAALLALIAVLDRHAGKFRGGCPPGELSLVFLRDRALAKLHGDFLDDPSATDVITFEGQPSLGIAGEICVSPDTAAKYAREHRRDFSSELTLYLVHGWLHLAGYDDLQPARKRTMRRAEARAMNLLHAAGPLPRFTLHP